ncbi:MAG: 3-oxoacyl-[acyl-carrier-protein] reductase [Candidatus Fischerbacteria bacterium RBG_13_37_8]|uniref:3-oxoacyl-[acyl-carrier-protein] reductase n=1 Tax=Candidatus Fischerbacteria bacterium RBG_13_37_8 TaxID=1817863 RepID=A0A1F5VFP9_9BACT|nr:MAG: 3-oxoacyl-[acyl-carrier-protein] reductase [Candidatus Fischerbacteria bacterium RBG_13_37_8]
MSDLENKVIVVTGGSQGIGAEIVRMLARHNARVVIWDVLEEKAQELCKELTQAGNECMVDAINVADEEMVKAGFEKVINAYDGIYGLVNNAGITRDNVIIRMSTDNWVQVMNINLTSMFLTSKYAVRHMLRQKEGSIVNLSSVVGLMGNIGQTNYAASKAGVIGFTKSLAKEVAGHNIRVNAIAPGFITTTMTEKIAQEIKDKFLQNIPMNRFGNCEEVANVVIFLLSSISSYITGTVINVNGGLYM